ncbi:DNA translocase FtsK [Bacillus thuringiensis]|uniref:Cell division protein FtsK n=1 Tax=Bacillus thuringiensis serovar toumanoffi TaxID=180862 RepID=A0ABD5I6X2_BACTU|nr:DNA translocase FtsK [Bacillus thuringiensis]MCR6782729.1 FtsK/SpoIIIE domain-containing protein [Bacillus thuringiensis]MCR6860800.1 FtsK/SpoIIIE domain-containing protein [Bacillus thuringiensis]MCR6863979.1 FtsK/SpoIIIE domain-containing protein [Bacillus thuringiensis]MDW9212856.1 Cell division protein FtsK [Bacillus thuringiensis serovar toumanoffi]MED2617979.1 DNA translocase FtsK [Bacillus thuringiensis]
MLDWMKKLFNKEEEQTALNKEVQKQIESQPKIPRVNHYTEAREAQMASRNAGKCRFPLVPDNGFDEEDEREVDRFEEQPVQGVTYEEPTAQRGIQVERSRRPYVEKVVSTYEEPEVQYEPVREAVVKKASAPSQESNRRPFRPTEMISPIYGYNRPSVEKKVEKQEEVKEREDLEISVEGKAVVDAWLEKKGYTLSDFSEGQATSSSPSHESVGQQDKKQEKSVVDQWLEKNGYEIERQEPLVEGKEVIQGMSTPQEVSADELLHKTVAEQMESAKLEKDVVVLNENNLQEELVASKVEHEDTILSEEIKRNTEIKQPTIEVEKQAPEESVIVKAEEKLEETIIVEIPEELEEVEVIAETEELEEVEVIAETKAPVVETFVALEEIQQEDEVIEQNSEFIHVAEADEQTKNDVQSFANVLIAETEENKRVEEEAPVVEEQSVEEEVPVVEEQPVVKKEEPKREKKRHVPFNVVMLKQDRTRLMERHAARANAMQPSANVRVENKPVQQEVAEPQVEEQPMQQVVVESQVEESPVQQVVAEPQVEEQPMQQVVAEPQVEEQPMQQVVVEPQVEESPVQQVVAEPQVEEQPMQQVVAEPQVEEQPMQQVVVEQVQKSISSTEPKEKAYVVNQRENDMRNVLHTPPTYTVPPLALLSIPQQSALDNTEWLDEQKELLDTTFNNFHVGAHVINVSQGPAVTRFEVQPDPGVKVNKITNLSDDIKLSLAAKDIRIEAPIPGKSAIGIEVPNKESKPVFLREILRSPVFTKSESPLTVALGLDISGDPIVTDIRKMPHGLIAGATGSGKSVCINAILTSILYKAKPHEVKLMLIDPKMVELAPYNSVPHLVAPVITDVKAATAALKWAVEEMERRYELFAHAGARDLTRYNTIVSEREIPGETLPYIVIVIDELADLMMVAPGDVEEAICRIAQKARACGIHLLVATQRPSVDVITGLIKSNIPTRIAFTVSSQVDSRTIIDIGGAEKLLGRGDMLFLGNGTSKPVRVQGVYVSDDEIEKTVDHVRKQMKPNYLFKQEDLLAKTEQAESEDELFFEACQFVVEQGGASTSSVQRKFRIGYNRAARLIEEMQSQGIISEARGTKPRDVLISEDEFAAMQETNV